MPELNESQFKQPHQMSPDEFALHPNSLFHGTWLPDNKIFDMELRKPESGNFEHIYSDIEVQPKIHLGTFAAALHRLHDTNRPTEGKTATIHTFWQTPHLSDFGGGIKALDNSPENMAHYLPGSMWYENQHEDDGSPSFATDWPGYTLKSQSDFVEDAIRLGKAKEVHPETMKRYKAGTLGKMRLNNNQVDIMYQHLYWPVKGTNRYALGAYTKAGPNWETLKDKGLWPLEDPSKLEPWDGGDWYY